MNQDYVRPDSFHLQHVPCLSEDQWFQVCDPGEVGQVCGFKARGLRIEIYNRHVLHAGCPTGQCLFAHSLFFSLIIKDIFWEMKLSSKTKQKVQSSCLSTVHTSLYSIHQPIPEAQVPVNEVTWTHDYHSEITVHFDIVQIYSFGKSVSIPLWYPT